MLSFFKKHQLAILPLFLFINRVEIGLFALHCLTSWRTMNYKYTLTESEPKESQSMIQRPRMTRYIRMSQVFIDH